MKNKMTWCAVLALLAAACLLGSMLANSAAEGTEVPLSYPEGGLSDSIFVSQNGTYQKNGALPATRELSGIPFQVDLPAGTSAVVGRGVIVKASDDLFAFVSEHDPSEGAGEVILREFPRAVLSDYDERYTYAEEKRSEEGYLNGYDVRYLFSSLVIANEEGAAKCHFAAYDVVLPDGETSENVTIAFVTTGQDEESLKRCKAWLDATLKTLRRSDGTERKAEAESAGGGEEKAAIRGDYSGLLEEGDEDACFVTFAPDREYGDMCVSVTAKRAVSGSSATLYAPDGRVLARCGEMGGDAMWALRAGKAGPGDGTFVLKVTRYSEYESLTVGMTDAGGDGE